MGNERVTVHNLILSKVDAEKNLLFVKGGVPGANSGYVVFEKASKLTTKSDRRTKEKRPAAMRAFFCSMYFRPSDGQAIVGTFLGDDHVVNMALSAQGRHPNKILASWPQCSHSRCSPRPGPPTS